MEACRNSTRDDCKIMCGGNDTRGRDKLQRSCSGRRTRALGSVKYKHFTCSPSNGIFLTNHIFIYLLLCIKKPTPPVFWIPPQHIIIRTSQLVVIKKKPVVITSNTSVDPNRFCFWFFFFFITYAGFFPTAMLFLFSKLLDTSHDHRLIVVKACDSGCRCNPSERLQSSFS